MQSVWAIGILNEGIPIVWWLVSVFCGIFLFASYIKIIRTVTANTRTLLSPPTDAPCDNTTDIS